jgi:eukaryotic-like serine/threonine-protein kinase
VGIARMPTATGIRKKLNPALLAGAPYREGELMAGRYQMKDALGVGPLGFVLRAQDRELGIDVSVKLIHPRFVQTPEERDAFASALEPARHFLHRSLTRLHDVGIDQGWPYFTYTFLDGLPLRRIIDSRLAKGQTFVLDEVEPILGQLMAALEAAHPAGAHGDLKAENILVLPDMLKVTDWGVAAGIPRPPFVQAERQKAAHRHLAPEYLAGLALDPRADVYSLGVLVGEMLTGLTPEDEIPELRMVNPELPDAVEGFYRRALSERPETRFRSVREMFETFASVVEGKPAALVADAVGEEGFEVVDFVETATVVTQPEPPPDVAASAAAPHPEAAPAPPAGPDSAALASGPTEGSAADALPMSTALSLPALAVEAPTAQPGPEPVSAVPPEPTTASVSAAEAEAPALSASPGEVDFWAETALPEAEPPSALAEESAKPSSAGTLWSEADDEEAEPEPEPAPPPLVAAGPPEVSAATPEAEPPAPLVSLPTPPPLPRIGERPVYVVPTRPPPAPPNVPLRPVVPSVGLWGPGARRTGVHAAVAVAVPEVLRTAEREVAPAAEVPEAPTAAPPVSPLPAPVPRPRLGPTVLAASVTAGAPDFPRPVERPPPAVAAPPTPAGAHEGGLWSPGAALAELVSEVRAESARQPPTDDATATPVQELAARAVAEQRGARERLALMSATDAPTVPVSSVSSPPRRVPHPRVVPVRWSALPRDRWLRLGLVIAIFFVIGIIGGVLLLRAH